MYVDEKMSASARRHSDIVSTTTSHSAPLMGGKKKKASAKSATRKGLVDYTRNRAETNVLPATVRRNSRNEFVLSPMLAQDDEQRKRMEAEEQWKVQQEKEALQQEQKYRQAAAKAPAVVEFKMKVPRNIRARLKKRVEGSDDGDLVDYTRNAGWQRQQQQHEHNSIDISSSSNGLEMEAVGKLQSELAGLYMGRQQDRKVDLERKSREAKEFTKQRMESKAKQLLSDTRSGVVDRRHLLASKDAGKSLINRPMKNLTAELDEDDYDDDAYYSDSSFSSFKSDKSGKSISSNKAVAGKRRTSLIAPPTKINRAQFRRNTSIEDSVHSSIHSSGHTLQSTDHSDDPAAAVRATTKSAKSRKKMPPGRHNSFGPTSTIRRESPALPPKAKDDSSLKSSTGTAADASDEEARLRSNHSAPGKAAPAHIKRGRGGLRVHSENDFVEPTGAGARLSRSLTPGTNRRIHSSESRTDSPRAGSPAPSRKRTVRKAPVRGSSKSARDKTLEQMMNSSGSILTFGLNDDFYADLDD